MSPVVTDSEPALSSLIFTLATAPGPRSAALSQLRTQPGLTLGEPQDRWVPAVLESNAPEDAFRALETLPGVELVEVVYVEVTPPSSPA